MANVRLYLDVDGVINAWSPFGDFTSGDDRYRRARAAGTVVTYRPVVVDAINTLSRSGVEVLWLTTWKEQDRAELTRALGFEQFRGLTREQENGLWWKTAAILNDFEQRGPAPFIWADDDLSIFEYDNLTQYLLERDQMVAIAPMCPVEPGLGLSDDELEFMYRFSVNPEPIEVTARD
ncbi:HAD domain-containing protein [Aeromicrobium sp. 179-A 4D2 NHS]|uniref:HAD domain-containing protein n=1 Tax=Aeromicrobium sp. 179-A 4D2 NHS TaxID=3142375 RepID=UPI00399F3197